MSGPPGPHAEYQARRAQRQADVDRLERADGRVANARLALFIAAAVVAIAVFALDRLAAAWLWVPAGGFLALVVLHDRVLARKARAARAVRFYDQGLARLEERWRGQGPTGARFAADDHPYAADLDLFGDGSLFQLVCTARTEAGEARLAAWLGETAPVAEVRARQTAVLELRPRLDLREELSLAGDDVRAAVRTGALGAWATAPGRLALRLLRPAAAALAAATVAALAGAIWLRLRPEVPAALLLLELGFTRLLRDRVRPVVDGVDAPSAELAVLARLFALLEREPVTCPRLVSLRAALGEGGLPASAQIARLARLVAWAEARHNQLFAPVGFVLLWTVQLAAAIERWRAACGPATLRWLAAAGELEALSSLAGYSFEHPDDPFPALEDEGPILEGDGLAHPLLPGCVPNDVRLGAARVLVISGSNMSGKSTLLRSVGVNAVLALAGGPVRARRLRLSALRPGATLRIQDSLAAGRSRFYAELLRLRAIAELSRGAPALFLLDELLAGTNSHDRRIGGAAIVRGLVGRGAIGLVTTHDLALAELGDGLGALAASFHFDDELRDGALVFDYRMKPGVVTRSNALELMRSLGLAVD